MRDGKAQLRLDRRLATRRGWISNDELAKELDALPDVSEKCEVIDLPGSPADEAADAVEDTPGLH